MKKFVLGCSVFFASIVIFAACQSGQAEPNSVQELIRAGKNYEAESLFQYQYDINEADLYGDTPLHVAAEQNAIDLTERFVSVGANTEPKNQNGDTPLLVALKNGSVDSAKILVENGADIFAASTDGKTALSLALASGDEYYDIFITEQSGKHTDASGKNILHYLVALGDEKAVALSIERNIPIDEKDSSGKTPLALAVGVKEFNDTFVQIAADLVLGGAEPVASEYLYFQTAVRERNLDYRADDGQTPLHLAAILGHESVCRYLLKNNAQPNNQDGTGATPLHEAVRYGRTKIAEMLLQSGANINAEDRLGKTPVMLYVPAKQQADIYNLLLSYNADLTHKDMYGDTVLHGAEMTHLRADLVKLLANFGADINARNKEGETPLSLAIENNEKEHVRFYAQKGADIHATSNKNETPLTAALKTDDLVRYLVLKNNVKSQDAGGNTPLHIALQQNAEYKKIEYIVSLLSDVNVLNLNGDSALYIAVKQNKEKEGNLLVSHGADIFVNNNKNISPLKASLESGNNWLVNKDTVAKTDGAGNTPLHYVAEWGMKDAAVLLLNNKADPEAKNSQGETPIFHAAKADKPDVINVLIVGGSSVFARDNLGSTPLHAAVRWDAKKAAQYLIEHGIDTDAQNMSGKTALAEAVAGEKSEMTNILLANGADVNVIDSSGRTLLMDAVKNDSVETVKLLLQYKANPNIQEMNGRNAFHEAAVHGNSQIVALIRQAGAAPLVRDKKGDTPFTLALDKNNDVILEIFGENKSVTDSDGNTPLHILAARNDSLSVMELLALHKFPIDTRNAAGETALSIAVSKGYKDKATVLLANGANPFITTDKSGNNAAVAALSMTDDTILTAIARFAGTKSDIQGNTLLHYAARTSSAQKIEKLLALGLDTKAKNISGETPSEVALRWKRTDIAELLK